jgi:hypothetical protein
MVPVNPFLTRRRFKMIRIRHYFPGGWPVLLLGIFRNKHRKKNRGHGANENQRG